MSATTIAGSSYAGRVIALLGAWPGVRTAPAECGVGVGVYTPAGQILHFHDESYADLRLTRPVIGRMRDVLVQSGRIFMVPGDDWIGMRLETFSDVTLLITLVSVAIKANLGAPPSPPSAGAAGAEATQAAVAVASCGAGRRRIAVPG